MDRSVKLWKKHWHLLSDDLILHKCIKEYPEITYKHSGSIRDRLVKSHYTRHQTLQREEPGILRWGSCDYCNLLIQGASFMLPNGVTHVVKHHISCQTRGVIYIILCQCGAFYVGKTIRPFWKRMKDHMYYSNNGLLHTPNGHQIAFRQLWPLCLQVCTPGQGLRGPRRGNFD